MMTGTKGILEVLGQDTSNLTARAFRKWAPRRLKNAHHGSALVHWLAG